MTDSKLKMNWAEDESSDEEPEIEQQQVGVLSEFVSSATWSYAVYVA